MVEVCLCETGGKYTEIGKGRQVYTISISCDTITMTTTANLLCDPRAMAASIIPVMVSTKRLEGTLVAPQRKQRVPDHLSETSI